MEDNAQRANWAHALMGVAKEVNKLWTDVSLADPDLRDVKQSLVPTLSRELAVSAMNSVPTRVFSVLKRFLFRTTSILRHHFPHLCTPSYLFFWLTPCIRALSGLSTQGSRQCDRCIPQQ